MLKTIKDRVGGVFQGDLKPSTRWIVLAAIALILWALLGGNRDAALGLLIIASFALIITEFLTRIVKGGRG